MTEPLGHEPDDSPPPLPKPTPKPGWIEGFAQRSTGLPGDVKGIGKNTPKGDKSPWSYAGLGIQFAGTVALFTWMGFELDKKMGWSPWGMVSLAMISVVGSLYLLIKDLVRENSKQDVQKKK